MNEWMDEWTNERTNGCWSLGQRRQRDVKKVIQGKECERERMVENRVKRVRVKEGGGHGGT